MKTSPEAYFGSYFAVSRIGVLMQSMFQYTGKREQDFLFIEPYSMGDCVHTLGLLPAFRRLYCDEGQRIILLCQHRAVQLSGIMPFVDACFGMDLDQHAVALEHIASITSTLSPTLPVICAPDMYGHGGLMRMPGGPMDRKRAIFYLKPDDMFTPPTVSEELRQATNLKMAEHGVERDNSVIIFPHALTLTDFGAAFWTALVDHIKDRKPEVKFFTDTTTGVAPILGTEPLTLSLTEVTPAVEFAGNGIFLRSGLIDLMAFSTANVLSLVPPPENYTNAPTHVPQGAFFIGHTFPGSSVVDVAVPALDPTAAAAVGSIALDRIASRSN